MAFVLILLSAVALSANRESFVSAIPSPTNGSPAEHTTIPANGDEQRHTGDNQKSCSCPTSVNTTTILPGQPDVLMQHQFYTQNVMMMPGMMCTCSMSHMHAGHRDDYHYTLGIGAHKLHTRATTWNDARKTCIEEGGHLAIINSMAEEHILLEIFNQSQWIKGAAYPDEALLGIHDLYKEDEWVTILGDSLAKTGYNRWSNKWGGQPDNGGGKQHCGALMKEGGMDDVSCEVPFPFFCELPRLKLLQ